MTPPETVHTPWLESMMLLAGGIVVPLGDVEFFSWAEQLAFEPPLLPVQPHDQGPVPDTAVAVPAVQSPLLGAADKRAPLEAPHAPFTGVVFSSGFALLDQLVPVQDHQFCALFS